MTQRNETCRRGFLRGSIFGAAFASAPYFFSSSRAFGDDLAEQRSNIGVIGAGGIAGANMNAARDWLNVVAVADVDASRRQKMNQDFAGGKAGMYSDYRRLLDRDDIGLVHIATPDHWHAKPLVEAMLSGKDVYCEKPLTLTIDEGKLVREVQEKTGRIVQVGTQQRSTFPLFVTAMAIVAEGRLGRIQRIQTAIGGAPSSAPIPVAYVPTDLDWDRWLGPAPTAEYRFSAGHGGRPKSNCHQNFRWWYDYSGGKLTDWGAHHVDIANWALKLNGQTTGPFSVEGSATHPVAFKDGKPTLNDRYNTATAFHFRVKYPGGTELVIRNDTDNGVLIAGDKGRIFVNRKRLVGKPVGELEGNPLPNDAVQKVYKGLPLQDNGRRAHWANFLRCVRERKDPISDVHSHMQMLNVCHLAGIVARLGRSVDWNDTAEEIIGDEQANSMLSRPYRDGYEIELG